MDEGKYRTFINNIPYARPGKYNTELHPQDEQLFKQWVQENRVPFDPSPTSDYDMRGFFQAFLQNDPRATNAVNPNDGQMHYPDYWKTPYHQSFSNESQWATPDAPTWNSQDQLVLKNGKIVFDERNR